ANRKVQLEMIEEAAVGAPQHGAELHQFVGIGQLCARVLLARLDGLGRTHTLVRVSADDLRSQYLQSLAVLRIVADIDTHGPDRAEVPEAESGRKHQIAQSDIMGAAPHLSEIDEGGRTQLVQEE